MRATPLMLIVSDLTTFGTQRRTNLAREAEGTPPYRLCLVSLVLGLLTPVTEEGRGGPGESCGGGVGRQIAHVSGGCPLGLARGGTSGLRIGLQLFEGRRAVGRRKVMSRGARNCNLIGRTCGVVSCIHIHRSVITIALRPLMTEPARRPIHSRRPLASALDLGAPSLKASPPTPGKRIYASARQVHSARRGCDEARLMWRRG